MTLADLQAGAGTLARWSAIALGATIPVSIVADKILCTVALGAWLASGGVRGFPARLRANPVALGALALWLALAAGLAWGVRDPGDGLQFLQKYSGLLLVPVFADLLGDAGDRKRALQAYAGAMTVTLVLSLALAAGLLPAGALKSASGQSVVFKLWLTQNILMAFGAYACLLLGREAQTARERRAWWAIAALAAANVLLVVPGRSGMLMLALLALYAGYAWRGSRGLAAAAVAFAAALGLAVAALPNVANRLLSVGAEARAWAPGDRTETSTGQRLEFYRVSAQLIARHPFAGTGTGSFPRVYREEIAGTAGVPSRNPHSEYLLEAVQIGVAGPLLLLALWAALWRTGRRLPPRERDLARGLALAFATGCLFNSLLLDHTEGLLFAWLAGLATGALRPAAGGPPQPA